MTRIDDAIKNFRSRNEYFYGRDDFNMMADALEEIRDRLNDLDDDKIQHQTAFRDVHQRLDALTGKDTPPTEQPATFKPWSDVVEIVGPTFTGCNDFIGFEGFVVDYDSADYGVRINDEDDTYYFPASSLKLVYRLKERVFQGLDGVINTGKQPEPTIPQFHYGQRVAFKSAPRPAESWKVISQSDVHVRLDSVPWCADAHDLIVLPDAYDQPEPIFKTGEYVFDGTDGRNYQVMQDTNGPHVQGRNLVSNQPVKLHADFLTKAIGLAPFHVGDWVQDGRDGPKFKLERVGPVCFGYDQSGTAWENEAHRLHKITPPAPRFTFGDRVRFTKTYDVFNEGDIGIFAELAHDNPSCCWVFLPGNLTAYFAGTDDLVLDTSTN